MEVGVRAIWEVIVNDDIHSFNINTTPHEVGCHKNTRVKSLEFLEAGKAFLLFHTRSTADGRKVAFHQKLIEFGGAVDLGDKNDDLVEFKDIKQVVEFSVFLVLLKIDIVLLKTVKGKFGLIVYVDLHCVLAKLPADWANVLCQGCREHHYLFLMRGCTEYGLHIFAHVKFFKHLVTFIHHKVFDMAEIHDLVLNSKLEHSSRSTNDNVRTVVLQQVSVLLSRDTSKEHCALHILQVLAKSLIFVVDLESQLSCVAQHNHCNLVVHWFKLVKRGKNKYCSFSHT
mmetsp:Transcript_27757/g.44424  ORF Transcript_27757/g.44424 Transcript_27757/m.44424 type:complete len:284 (-) Transcript_27757:628-1479(-)